MIDYVWIPQECRVCHIVVSNHRHWHLYWCPKRYRTMHASGVDVHTQLAARLFGVPEREVTPSQRREAKVINHANVYKQQGTITGRFTGRIPLTKEVERR
jgi:hypothetical protein